MRGFAKHFKESSSGAMPKMCANAAAIIAIVLIPHRRGRLGAGDSAPVLFGD